MEGGGAGREREEEGEKEGEKEKERKRVCVRAWVCVYMYGCVYVKVCACEKEERIAPSGSRARKREAGRRRDTEGESSTNNVTSQNGYNTVAECGCMWRGKTLWLRRRENVETSSSICFKRARTSRNPVPPTKHAFVGACQTWRGFHATVALYSIERVLVASTCIDKQVGGVVRSEWEGKRGVVMMMKRVIRRKQEVRQAQPPLFINAQNSAELCFLVGNFFVLPLPPTHTHTGRLLHLPSRHHLSPTRDLTTYLFPEASTLSTGTASHRCGCQ